MPFLVAYKIIDREFISVSPQSPARFHHLSSRIHALQNLQDDALWIQQFRCLRQKRLFIHIHKCFRWADQPLEIEHRDAVRDHALRSDRVWFERVLRTVPEKQLIAVDIKIAVEDCLSRNELVPHSGPTKSANPSQFGPLPSNILELGPPPSAVLPSLL